MKQLYRVLIAINAIALALLLFFFLWGIQDGSVSAFNILLWLALLAVPSATLAGGALAWGKGQRALALVLLLVPALPALFFAIFFLAMIILQPNWH
jgi:hypothetical protein